MGRAIFLSYRRADTADVVGRANDALLKEFGEKQIFRDVDNIPMGVDFTSHIRDTLKKCRILLAFIGPNWIDARDGQGQRRLDDPNDLVRIELETALKTRKLLVVPILVNDARMPSSDALPITLRDLSLRNAGVMRRDPDFNADMTRLVEALRTHLRTGRLDLSALGGVATRAAGLSVGVAAAWVIAGGLAVSAAVPEVRETVLSTGSQIFEQLKAEFAHGEGEEAIGIEAGAQGRSEDDGVLGGLVGDDVIVEEGDNLGEETLNEDPDAPVGDEEAFPEDGLDEIGDQVPEEEAFPEDGLDEIGDQVPEEDIGDIGGDE